jgi:hypothetical protein
MPGFHIPPLGGCFLGASFISLHLGCQRTSRMTLRHARLRSRDGRRRPSLHNLGYGIRRIAGSPAEFETWERALFSRRIPWQNGLFCLFNSELRQLVGRAAYTDCGACGSAASTSDCDNYISDADDCTERGYSHSASSDCKH